jgi:multicomponent Na+:H+ antiporter subunit C
MDLFHLYGVTSVILIALSLYGFLYAANLVLKILTLNMMGGSTFLLLIAVAYRNRDPDPDPVPHAMVLTGIVVAVSATALALVLARRLFSQTGRDAFPEDEDGR